MKDSEGMKEKRVKFILRKNLILDFNDYYEDYFDESYEFEENKVISNIKAFLRSLFKMDRY